MIKVGTTIRGGGGAGVGGADRGIDGLYEANNW